MVRIAITGGGIGGLTTAIALRQVGFEPEVYEQAPELIDVGAAIAIWPNAMRVLERLNLVDKILERAGVMEEIRWLDQNGRLINKVSISETRADRRASAVALHRADLQSILLHALPPSSIHLGYTLVSHTQRGDKMIATFANGHAVETNFLIGADGIHSRMRAQFINDGEPIFRGYTVGVGYLQQFRLRFHQQQRSRFMEVGSDSGLARLGWAESAGGLQPTTLTIVSCRTCSTAGIGQCSN
jgi:salicylate hydroxylase